MLECIMGALNMNLIWENGTVQECLVQENYSFKEFRAFINMPYPQVLQLYLNLLSEWEREKAFCRQKELLLIETKTYEMKLAAASAPGK